MSLVIVTHDRMLDHDPGPGMPERPERLAAVLSSLRAEPIEGVRWEDAEPAPIDAIRRVHAPRHVEAVLVQRGFAGEAGHMVIDADGPECVCGRHGCWETYASGRALGRLTRRAARDGRVPAIVASAGGIDSIESEDVSSLVARGHPEALAMLEELGWWAGLGLTNLVDVLDVSAIILGGGLSAIGEPLLLAIRRGFVAQQHDLDHRPPVLIELAAHGPDAGARGAAMLARA